MKTNNKNKFKNAMFFVLNVDSKIIWKDQTTDRAVFWLCCQIENSLELGWSKEDIIIGTNFKFKYRGIESVILKDICPYSAVMSKIYGVRELMNNGVIDKDVWVHDLDAWQNCEFEFPNIADIGITTSPSGRIDEPPRTNNSGSFFVRTSGLDLVEKIIEHGDQNRYKNDEHAINHLNPNLHPEYSDRVMFVDQTFNMGGNMRRYCLASKPIKVIHNRFVHDMANPGRCPGNEQIASNRLWSCLQRCGYEVRKHNLENKIKSLGAEYETLVVEGGTR